MTVRFLSNCLSVCERNYRQTDVWQRNSTECWIGYDFIDLKHKIRGDNTLIQHTVFNDLYLVIKVSLKRWIPVLVQWKYFNHQNLKRFKVKIETWVWTLGGFYSAISHSVKGNAQKMIFGGGTWLTVNSGEFKYIFNKYLRHYVQNNMMLFLELREFNMWRFHHQNESKLDCCNAETRVRSWTCHRWFSTRDVKKKSSFQCQTVKYSPELRLKIKTTISHHIICQCGSVMLLCCDVYSLLTSLILTGLIVETGKMF